MIRSREETNEDDLLCGSRPTDTPDCLIAGHTAEEANIHRTVGARNTDDLLSPFAVPGFSASSALLSFPQSCCPDHRGAPVKTQRICGRGKGRLLRPHDSPMKGFDERFISIYR